MNYQISSASIRDLGGLHRLEHACFDKDAWTLLDLIAVLTFPELVRLKATDNGRLVGFIAGDPRPSEGFSWISTIGVLPEYRRQGIAKALLLACESRIRTPRVRLSVRISNQAAIQLYERESYRTIDIWRKYYDDGEDAIVMEKTLDSNGL